MDGKHLVILYTVLFNNFPFQTFTLVDTNTTSFGFVEKDFVRVHSLPLQAVKDTCSIEVIDGPPIDSAPVTHIAWLRLNIHSY